MRVRILALVTVLLLLVGALPAPTQTGGDKKGGDKKKDPDTQKKEKEPEKITADTKIGGKTLDQWIDMIPVEKNKDRSQTEIAIKNIILYGPNLAKKAVPVLIAEMNRHKPGAGAIDMSVRVNGTVALGMILANTEKPNQKDVDAAIAIFKRWIKDDQVIVRFRVAQALAQMGPLAKELMPELCKLVKDFDTWETRHAAVIALGTVAWDEKHLEKQALDALYVGINDSTIKVRLGALASLNSLKVAEIDAEKPRLKKELDARIAKETDHVWQVRAHLTVFHSLNGAAKKKRLETIIKYLADPDPAVRLETTQALGHLADEAKDAVAGLLEQLRESHRDKEYLLMGWTCWALGRMEGLAKSALPELEKITKDMDVPESFHETAQEAHDVITGKLKLRKDDKKGDK